MRSIEKQGRLSVMVIGLFLFWFIGIAGADAAAADSDDDISVVDDFGKVVVLKTPAQRIISFAPHNTENLFSAGAGDKVVGVVEYSDYPPKANDIQSVGSYIQFNLEVILALKPDLIVAWKNGNNKEALERIERFGIPIYYSEPRSFQDIIDNILELAMLAGTENNVDPSINNLAEDLLALKHLYENKEVIDVFYQVWRDPLMTLNGDHFVSRVLELCGARNLFSHLPIIAPRVSMEAVIQSNPDVIITGLTEGLAPDMSMWEKWMSVKAVKNDHYIFVESDTMHRHTLRMLNGIADFCKKIDGIRM